MWVHVIYVEHLNDKKSATVKSLTKFFQSWLMSRWNDRICTLNMAWMDGAFDNKRIRAYFHFTHSFLLVSMFFKRIGSIMIGGSVINMDLIVKYLRVKCQSSALLTPNLYIT